MENLGTDSAGCTSRGSSPLLHWLKKPECGKKDNNERVAKSITSTDTTSLVSGKSRACTKLKYHWLQFIVTWSGQNMSHCHWLLFRKPQAKSDKLNFSFLLHTMSQLDCRGQQLHLLSVSAGFVYFVNFTVESLPLYIVDYDCGSL